MLKSEMLTRSTRCFVLGWCSLLPILGTIAALLALLDFRAVVVGKGSHWNAARTRLLIGAWLATLGLLITLVTVTLFAMVILKKISEG
jgi:hypothetical protein